jgi:hypothetical protein
MAELIYHDPSDRTGISPFHRAIQDITKDEEVLITCPYIAPDYLKDVTEQTEEWFLLTDVGDWLSIHSQSNREAVQKFLIEHRDHVRQVEDLHAKVVIGDDRALIGSANFTTKGLTGRTEMSILFDDPDIVNELTDWFESVWSIYGPPSVDRVEEYIQTASTTSNSAQNQSPSSFAAGDSPNVGTASLGRDEQGETTETDDEGEEDHEKLVEWVSKGLSPEWVDCYFDLLDDLISATGLSNTDPRLVTSLPQDGRIPVSINNRYVLVAMRPAGSATHGRYRDDYEERVQEYSKWATTGFILGPDTDNIEELIEMADFYFPFKTRSEGDGEPPHYVEYVGEPDRMIDRDFKEAWLNAATNQIERAEGSPYKQYHEPVVYRAARDGEYREKVIHEAFKQD